MAEDTRQYTHLKLPKAKLIELAEAQIEKAEQQREGFDGAFDTVFEETMAKVKDAVRKGELTPHSPITQDTRTLTALGSFALRVSGQVQTLDQRVKELKSQIAFWQAAEDDSFEVNLYNYQMLENYVTDIDVDELWQQTRREAGLTN